MAGEVARGRKFAKLVTDHLFRHRDRNELLTIVDVERQADELRQDGAATRPGLDRLVGAAVLSTFGLLEKAELDERAFPDGTSHFRLPLLLRVTRTDNHLVRLLVVTSTGTLGRLAPRSHRMATARGPAFTAAVRVIDRVLGHAAGQRLDAHPALAAGFGKVLVLVVGVRNRANRTHAIGPQITLLARVEADDHQTAIAPDQLDIGARAARDLTALARLHLHIVADRADRHLAQQHGVARLGIDALASHHRVANSKRSEEHTSELQSLMRISYAVF